MRALHFVKTSVGGSWAWRQMRELVALGYEVHVGLPPVGPMISLYEQAGVNVHLLEVDPSFKNPRALRKSVDAIAALEDSIRPDVVHLHNVKPALLARQALGRRGRVPRVFQVPGPLHMEHVMSRALDLRSAGPSDYWLASCQYTYRLYESAGVGIDRLGVALYGTDVSSFETTINDQALRGELGIPHGRQVVGMVAYFYAPKRLIGQMRGLKGHEDLIDALALLLEQGSDVTGVFVGGAWAGAVGYEGRVRRYASERLGDRGLFLGTRNDVRDLYAAFDVVAHPSHSENLGGAAESLLCGVPTVATAVGGFPELVIPGRTGWLVPPRNPKALAAALKEALEDPERSKQHALEGQRLARRLLDVQATTIDVADFYRSIGVS